MIFVSIFQTLSPVEKEKYAEMAKNDKANNTRQHVLVDEVKQQEMVEAAEMQIIKNFIKQKAFDNGNTLHIISYYSTIFAIRLRLLLIIAAPHAFT